jgi:hypothetical protein
MVLMNSINLSNVGELVGVRQASHLLDVCPQTVFRMIARGDIRATRVGLAGRGRGAFRIQVREISDYLRSRQAEAGDR